MVPMTAQTFVRTSGILSLEHLSGPDNVVSDTLSHAPVVGMVMFGINTDQWVNAQRVCPVCPVYCAHQINALSLSAGMSVDP